MRGGAGPFIAALPIDAPALGLPPPTIVQLRDLGVRTAGALARLPAAGVGLRFGAEGLAVWREVTGAHQRPLHPWAPSPTLSVAHRDEEGIADTQALGRAVAALAARLAGQLRARGQATALLSLHLATGDGACRVRAAHLPEPLHVEGAIGVAAADLLAALRPAAPVEGICLIASALGRPPMRQQGLWPGTPGTPGTQGAAMASAARLQAAIAAHRRRYGHAELGRVRIDPDAPDGWRCDAWDAWDDTGRQP